MNESHDLRDLSGASDSPRAPGMRVITRRTSFGLSKTLAKFARTEGLKLEINDAIPIIDRIDNILVTSPNASSGGQPADLARVVVGAVWRKECATERDSTGRDEGDDRAWIKHLAVVRAGLLLLFPSSTEEADLVNLHTTVRPLGFLRLKGASVTCSISDETGAEDRLGNCLLHITEMPSLPPLSATVNLAAHTARSLAPIAEAPSSPSAVPPPVHAVLACRSATQARRWERVLIRAAALCEPPIDPSPRSPRHHSRHHPHASDDMESLGASHASGRGGSWQLSKTSRFLLTSTSSTTSFGQEHRHRDGFPFKEGHLHLLTPQGGRVGVVCRLDRGQLCIQPAGPHESVEGVTLPRRLALQHFRVAHAQQQSSTTTSGEAAGPASLTLEPAPLGMSLSSTSRFGGSISLSITQSAYFHPPSTSRLFRAPSTDKEDMESSMRSLQPFQQSARRSPRISGMGEKLPSERSVFGEGVGAGEEGEQGAVTLLCGDVEECATWRSLLTRSIRLATLGATHRTGTGTGTGTRRVRTHRRQVTASTPRPIVGEQAEDPAAPLQAHKGPVLSGEARVLVEGLLRGHWLFHSMGDLNPLLDHMTLSTPPLGDVITWQGEGVSCLYVVECGLLEATSAPTDEAVNEEGTQGPTRTMLARGAMIGELALVHSSASEATVRVVGGESMADNAREKAEGCRLWALSRHAFRALLHAALTRQQQHKCAFLRTLPMFAHLTDAQVSSVADTLQCVVLEQGDNVGGHASQEATHLFLLHSGTAIATQGSGDGEGEEGRGSVVLGAGDWVADVACQGTQGHVEVRATGRLECFVVSEAELQALLGTHPATQALQTAAQTGRLALHFGTVPCPPSAPVHPPIPPPVPAPSDVQDEAGGDDVYAAGGSEGADPHLSLRSLRHVKVMGRGSFGKVMLVAHEGSGGYMALKVLSKYKLQMTRQVRAVQTERGLLSDVSLRAHPFVVSLLKTFQDQRRVYMLLELLPGGELWTLLHGEEPPPLFLSGPYGGLPTQACAFYVAQCVSVLSHLHAHCHVIYRDLKPENLCMDTHGYLKLVDFGFAKRLQAEGEERTFTVCGTPEYLAPEIVRGNGYGYAADLWSLGVLTFELLTVYTPFQAQGPMQVYEKVCRSEVTLAEEVASLDPPLDPHAHSFIAALLHPNPALRLGACGVGMEGLWSHPLLSSLDPVALRHRALPPPYVPALQDLADAPVSQSYGDEEDEFDDDDYDEEEQQNTEDGGVGEGPIDADKGIEGPGDEQGPPTGAGEQCGKKVQDEFVGF